MKTKMMSERETGRGEVREIWAGGVCVCREKDGERDREGWKAGRSDSGGDTGEGGVRPRARPGTSWKENAWASLYECEEPSPPGSWLGGCPSSLLPSNPPTFAEQTALPISKSPSQVLLTLVGGKIRCCKCSRDY